MAESRSRILPQGAISMSRGSHFSRCLYLHLHGYLTKCIHLRVGPTSTTDWTELWKSSKTCHKSARGAHSNFLTETSQLGPPGATGPCAHAGVYPVCLLSTPHPRRGNLGGSHGNPPITEQSTCCGFSPAYCHSWAPRQPRPDQRDVRGICH